MALSKLEKLCFESKRYSEKFKDVLKTELEIIKKQGLEDYFCQLSEIIKDKAYDKLILRGTTAGSIVSYLVGVTNVCPYYGKTPYILFIHSIYGKNHNRNPVFEFAVCDIEMVETFKTAWEKTSEQSIYEEVNEDFITLTNEQGQNVYFVIDESLNSLELYTREDVFDFLYDKNADYDLAFDVMEFVRKGKAGKEKFSDEWKCYKEKLAEFMGKDELKIFAEVCKKIDYLPTRTTKFNEVSLKMKVDLAGGAK